MEIVLRYKTLTVSVQGKSTAFSRYMTGRLYLDDWINFANRTSHQILEMFPVPPSTIKYITIHPED